MLIKLLNIFSLSKSCLNETTCEEPTKRIILPDVDANFTACSNSPSYIYNSTEDAKELCANVSGVDENDIDAYPQMGLCLAPCPIQNDAYACLNTVIESLPKSVPDTGPMLSAYVTLSQKHQGNCFSSSITTDSNGTLTCSTDNCFAEETDDCFNGLVELTFGIFRHEDDCFTENLLTYDSQTLTQFRGQALLVYYTGTMKGTCSGSDCIASGTETVIEIAAAGNGTSEELPNGITADIVDCIADIPDIIPNISLEWKVPASNEPYAHQVLYEDDAISFQYSPNHNVSFVFGFDTLSDFCTGGGDLFGCPSGDESCTDTLILSDNGTYYFYCPNHCEDGMQLLVTVLPIGTTPTPSTPGSYNDPYDQMEIKQCEIGKYQDEPGQTECKQIQDCLPGTFQIYFNNVVGSDSDNDCRPCTGETYTNEINSHICSECPSEQKANEENTGCVPASDEDADTVEAWIWILVGGGSGILFIVAVVLIVRSRQRRAGKFSMSKGSNSMIRALIY